LIFFIFFLRFLFFPCAQNLLGLASVVLKPISSQIVGLPRMWVIQAADHEHIFSISWMFRS